MFWLLGGEKKNRDAEQRDRGLGICCVHMFYSYSTQKGSVHRPLRVILLVVETVKCSLPRPVNHTHTGTHTHRAHNADFSFWPTHAAQLGSAQQQQNGALCPPTPHPPLVLLNDASPAHTCLHHFHYTSSPSKSLSFLLLITVVGPFELFKAARKDPQCSQKR